MEALRSRVKTETKKKGISTEQLLILDWKKEENRIKIQKALRKIKPFAKYVDQDVPLEMLEKFVCKMTMKYNIEIQWVNYVVIKNNVPFWSASVKQGGPDHEWLGSVDGICLYELMCKVCILFYVNIKKEKVKEREERE